jgi:molecular chaperone DnaK
MATIDFGIDLGTTNSSIVCCRAGVTRIFQTAELMNVTPSVVYVGKTGRMLVGKKAYDAWPADSLNTQAEFKRWMGFSDTLSFPAANKKLSAEDLSAEILKSLREDVRRATGETVTAAVVTVPAAFGTLQCDATGRAAAAAGLLEAPLLQEPIAAAIAYGAAAGAKDQRWMVFDLGGGTLDIAIVSTRNGRLAVLEHQGNNRLGGKDLDRLLAENVLWPEIAKQYRLPERSGQRAQYDRLFRQLVRVAEQAKIGLSTSDSVPVELFQIGDDLDGTPIEATLTLTREELQRQAEPFVGECLALVERALAGARLEASAVDRLILVGGPTQMPLVRDALRSRIGDKLDFNVDPMTVVAQGAALYASTLERKTAAAVTVAVTATASGKSAAGGGAVTIDLKHERASGTAKSPVAGIVPASAALTEVKIDAEDRTWSSGWIKLIKGRFAVDVLLSAGKPTTRFEISGRGATGSAIAVEPRAFAIASMLPMAAPPLPHAIAVEMVGADGKEKFDTVFARQVPLPAEARRTYRAERTLRPSEPNATLPIKLWEVDLSEDASERWWAGCVHVRADKLKRPLLEGTEIELTFKIDTSRKLTVDVFVPTLNQGFTNEVYVPDPPSTRNQLSEQLGLCFERVYKVFEAIYAADREDLRDAAESLQLKLEVIAEQMAEEEARGNPDPDALLGPTDRLRQIRTLIGTLEKEVDTGGASSPLVIKMRAERRWTSELVGRYGKDEDRETFTRLSSQFDRYVEVADARGLKFVREQMNTLRGQLVHEQQEYWTHSLNYLQRPGQQFVNRTQAAALLKEAAVAQAQQNLPALRNAIVQLWRLQPPDQADAAREQQMQSGLKTD